MEPIRLLIADDHALVRAGIRSLLRGMPDFQVVGEASDGVQALELVADLLPNVLLTDIAMPHLNGLQLAERVTKEFPATRVIIVSMHADEEFIGQAVRIGATGYLLKDANATELEFAVKAVHHGETYLTPSASKKTMASYLQLMGNSDRQPADPLTPRQREILQLIVQGKTTKGIAAMLQISAKTVETHRAQIMERLAIYDIPGLVRYAMRTGLTPREN